MKEREFLFDIKNPEKYPYGYELINHKIRTGMYYEEYIPNFPPEGEWVRSGPFLHSNIIRIIRID